MCWCYFYDAPQIESKVVGLWLNVSYKMYPLFVSRIQNVYAHPTFQKVQSSTNLILAISGKHFIFHFVFYPQDCLNVLDLTFFGVKIKRNSTEISKKKILLFKKSKFILADHMYIYFSTRQVGILNCLFQKFQF